MTQTLANGVDIRRALQGLVGKSFVSVEQIGSPETLQALFRVADYMRDRVEAKQRLDLLAGHMIPICFYEQSTRTFCSFYAAALRLGAYVLPIHEMGAYSSAVKGETLEDTMRTMVESTAASAIVLRHPDDLSSKRASNAADPVPVISGGSGKYEHPTQAGLDTYTIHAYCEQPGELAFVGDLKYGRTVQSLSRLGAIQYPNAVQRFVSPEELRPPEELVDYLTSRGIKTSFHTSIEDVIQRCDVLYMTRIQQERMDPSVFERAKGRLRLTNSLVELMKPTAIVLHPLPRVDEVTYDVDNNPRAKYFKQMRAGLYIRMALLCVILDCIPNEILD